MLPKKSGIFQPLFLQWPEGFGTEEIRFFQPPSEDRSGPTEALVNAVNAVNSVNRLFTSPRQYAPERSDIP